MAPICENNSRDSNEVEFSFAEEECLRELPEEVAAIAATGQITLTTNVLAAVAATGSFTVASVPSDGDTVTVGGTVITFRAASPGANEVLIGGTVNATASALAPVINALANVSAVASGASVNITAATAGTTGNSITLATSSANVTRSGATLTGGTAAHTVTVAGSTFTFVSTAPGAAEVQQGGTTTVSATNLAAKLTALATVNAASAAAVVTVTAATAGEDGNLIAMSKSGTNIALSGATLTGGEERVPGAQWFGTEPNSFADFGSELTKSVRSFINPGRQRRKGRTVGEEASGGYQTDFTKTSLNRLLQGFMFADARELPTTKSVVRPVGVDRLISVAAATGYRAKTDAGFAADMIVLASGFTNSANNGLKVVSSVTPVDYDVQIQVTPAPVDETFNDGSSRHLEGVGYQFADGAVNFAVTDDIPSLVSGTVDFTTLANFVTGAWLFIGGDASVNRFANNVGYARIKSVSESAVIFDDVTFTPTTEAGTGKSLRVFVGSIIRNEKASSLIKMRSYHLERTLGEGENGTQAEYLEGAIANEFSLTIPTEEKMTADLTFAACKRTFRTGDPGDELKIGERFEASGDEVFNTTSDIYRMRISLNDPTSATLTPLVGYVSEGSLSITNNASPNKAISVLGALDFQFGDFEVSGSLTAYFTDVSAPKAIKNDVDASFNMIGGYDNYGFVYDMPLLTLSGGSLTVEKDAAIMLPIEKSAVECEGGYTLLYQHFPYLPDLAMPE